MKLKLRQKIKNRCNSFKLKTTTRVYYNISMHSIDTLNSLVASGSISIGAACSRITTLLEVNANISRQNQSRNQGLYEVLPKLIEVVITGNSDCR